MNIQITHTIEIGENTKTFLTALFTTLSGGSIKAPTAETPAKAPRGSKPKDTPTNNGGSEGGAGSSDNSGGELITFDMLKARFAEKKAEGKNDALKKLLADNGVAALSGLKEAQYKYFYDEAGKL